jgi:hypothetical protein
VNCTEEKIESYFGKEYENIRWILLRVYSRSASNV